MGDHRTLSAEVVLPPASMRLHTSCPLTSERVPNHEREGSSHSELSGRLSTSLNGNKTLRSHMHRSANPMTAGKMSHHSRGYDSDLIGNDEWKAPRRNTVAVASSSLPLGESVADAPENFRNIPQFHRPRLFPADAAVVGKDNGQTHTPLEPGDVQSPVLWKPQVGSGTLWGPWKDAKSIASRGYGCGCECRDGHGRCDGYWEEDAAVKRTLGVADTHV